MSTTQKQQQTTRQTGEKGKRAGRPVRQTANPQQVLEAPDTLQPGELLAAQQQFGNQVVQRAVDGNRRRGEGLTDEQGNLHSNISDTIQQERGGGSPLPKTFQAEMTQGLGHDFSGVRIHTGGKADVLSRKIHARAFTVGRDIFFRGGVFAPETSRGRETLIHELTHVVQQASSGRSTSGRLKLGEAGNSLEQQAERTAQRLNKAPAVGAASAAAAGAVQKQPAEEEEILQAQPAEEEEILQSQGDEDEIQRQAMDEEEIQTQGEEEEIQTEPDSGPVVQRIEWPWKKKLPDVQGPAQQVAQWTKSKVPFSSGWNRGNRLIGPKAPEVPNIPQAPALDPTKLKPPVSTGVGNGRSLAENIRGGKMAMDLTGTGDQMERLNALDANQRKKTVGSMTSESMSKGLKKSVGKVNAEESVQRPKEQEKNRLLGIIRNTGSSAEDVQAAEEKLRMLHKKKIGFNVANSALDERKNALKEAARRGDQKAFDQLKAEKAKGMMPNKWQRFKKFATSTAETVSGVVSKVKGAVMDSPLGGNIEAAKAQFMGGSKEKENSGGGGGGGGGGVMEQMVAMLLAKVQKLESDLAAKK